MTYGMEELRNPKVTEQERTILDMVEASTSKKEEKIIAAAGAVRG